MNYGKVGMGLAVGGLAVALLAIPDNVYQKLRSWKREDELITRNDNVRQYALMRDSIVSSYKRALSI